MGIIRYKGSESSITYKGQESPMMYKDEEYNGSGVFWPFKHEYEIIYQEKYGTLDSGGRHRDYYKHSNLGKAIVCGGKFDQWCMPFILISDIETEVYFDIFQGSTEWNCHRAEPILIDGHQFYHSLAEYADTNAYNGSVPANSIIQVSNGNIFNSFDDLLQAFINEAHI